MRSASYLEKPVYHQKKLITDARKHLKQFEPYDALVGIGLSGALAIPLIAFKLEKRFCIVRKKKHSSHSYETLEGNVLSKDKWIFVDDMISSGKTFTRVCHHMQGYSKCLGIYLYNENEIVASDKADLHDNTINWLLNPGVIRRVQKRLRR